MLHAVSLPMQFAPSNAGFHLAWRNLHTRYLRKQRIERSSSHHGVKIDRTDNHGRGNSDHGSVFVKLEFEPLGYIADLNQSVRWPPRT